ncbi:MAG: hypothetical protein GKR89_05600 [Candidatus Latescibacteria bacterium]|nr:hypothetical protein [Candidatus Latescibacterota bacterium]
MAVRPTVGVSRSLELTRRVLLPLLFIALLGGCGQAPGPQKRVPVVLAQVDTATITDIDFERALAKLEGPSEDAVRSAAEWREQFQLLIDRELLWREAQGQGLDKSPEVLRRLRSWERAQLTQALLQAEMGDRLGWDENELATYFADSGADREIRLARLPLRDRQQAVAALARAQSGNGLGELAAELGLAVGETDWLNALSIRDPRLSALFLQEVGAVELIEAAGQFVLVKVVAQRRVELDQRRDMAIVALERKKQTLANMAYLEYLTGKYEVALDTTALQRLVQAPLLAQEDPNLRLVRSKLGNWTLADYRRTLEGLPSQTGQKTAGALGLHITRVYIVDQLLGLETEEKGLREKWDRQRLQMHKQQAIEALWQHQTLSRVSLTEAEAAAYFEAHRSRYTGSPQSAALRAQVVQDLREEKAAPLFEEYLTELRRRDEGLVAVEEENFQTFVARRRRAENPASVQ